MTIKIRDYCVHDEAALVSVRVSLSPRFQWSWRTAVRVSVLLTKLAGDIVNRALVEADAPTKGQAK